MVTKNKSKDVQSEKGRVEIGKLSSVRRRLKTSQPGKRRTLGVVLEGQAPAHQQYAKNRLTQLNVPPLRPMGGILLRRSNKASGAPSGKTPPVGRRSLT